ncbi:unnamed protein product [Linum trigynum]|uniref:RNase H type-1 domain-containing protein n=1 Tax=Linum trigynum TaxID=586398 RepID=A0AAV2G7P0_9ROSI
MGQFLVALWFLWEERNNQLWNKKKLKEFEVMGKAERWLTDYLDHQQRQVSTQGRGEYRWSPPSTVEFKVNVDVACFEEEGSRFGVVIPDNQGNFLLAAVRRRRTQWVLEMVECRTISLRANLTVEHGLVHWHIEMDCLSIVQKMKKEVVAIT